MVMVFEYKIMLERYGIDAAISLVAYYRGRAWHDIVPIPTYLLK